MIIFSLIVNRVPTRTDEVEDSAMESTILEGRSSALHIDDSSSSSSSPPQRPVVTEVLERPVEKIKVFESTPEKIVLKPSCFDPVPEPDLSQIRLPVPYEDMSTTDRRKFQCLASYRLMKIE